MIDHLHEIVAALPDKQRKILFEYAVSYGKRYSFPEYRPSSGGCFDIYLLKQMKNDVEILLHGLMTKEEIEIWSKDYARFMNRNCVY